MRIINRELIDEFIRKHADARNSINSWLYEVKYADWRSSQDIKDRYAKASFLGNNQVIFNIKGNDYRMVVKVAYHTQTVFIQWIGTHAEYNKKKF